MLETVTKNVQDDMLNEMKPSKLTKEMFNSLRPCSVLLSDIRHCLTNGQYSQLFKNHATLNSNNQSNCTTLHSNERLSVSLSDGSSKIICESMIQEKNGDCVEDSNLTNDLHTKSSCDVIKIKSEQNFDSDLQDEGMNQCRGHWGRIFSSEEMIDIKSISDISIPDILIPTTIPQLNTCMATKNFHNATSSETDFTQQHSNDQDLERMSNRSNDIDYCSNASMLDEENGSGCDHECDFSSNSGIESSSDITKFASQHGRTDQYQDCLDEISSSDMINTKSIENMSIPTAVTNISRCTGALGQEFHVSTPSEPDMGIFSENPYDGSTAFQPLHGQESENLKNHQTSDNKANCNGNTSVSCDNCNKSFLYIGSLNEPEETHSVKKPFKCDVCDKSFTKNGSLTVHKRIHTGEKPFICDICNKSFSHKSNLNVHKKTHSGKKPFKCNVCNKSFALNGNLTVHKRIHTGEKPFKCDICHKSFSHKSTLNHHNRTHSGKKPFKCDICNKSFALNGNLTVHKQIHTREKPFKCDICNKSFAQISTLHHHKQIHSGRKPFKCVSLSVISHSLNMVI